MSRALEPAVVKDLADGFLIEDVALDATSHLSATVGRAGGLSNVSLSSTPITQTHWRSVRMRDVVGEDLDGAGADWLNSSIQRTVLRRCRLTGMQLAQAHLRDVTFDGCKLDYAGFRRARLEHVTFRDCLLEEADFVAAMLHDVLFEDCRLRETEFTNARMRSVDLRTSQLHFRGDVTALRGTTITPLQLIDLAPALAQELGISVVSDAD